MKEIKTVAYPVRKDLTQLLQNKISEHIDKKEQEMQEFERNKAALLPYVLEYVHSICELHNMKCDRRSNHCGKYAGLLGYGKRDIDKEIRNAVEVDAYWSADGKVFKNTSLKVHIWLNCKGLVVNTPNLPYSMTGPFSKTTYGKSIDSEVEALAEIIARCYPDDWD